MSPREILLYVNIQRRVFFSVRHNIVYPHVLSEINQSDFGHRTVHSLLTWCSSYSVNTLQIKENPFLKIPSRLRGREISP